MNREIGNLKSSFVAAVHNVGNVLFRWAPDFPRAVRPSAGAVFSVVRTPVKPGGELDFSWPECQISAEQTHVFSAQSLFTLEAELN